MTLSGDTIVGLGEVVVEVQVPKQLTPAEFSLLKTIVNGSKNGQNRVNGMR